MKFLYLWNIHDSFNDYNERLNGEISKSTKKLSSVFVKKCKKIFT